MKKDSEKEKFPTKKDLSYCIVILVLVLIGSFTFYYGSDKDMVSHVGFGGTIISIVLAVVAIIYSFYQSSTYENTTHKLDSSAQKIEDATKQLSDVSEMKNILDGFTREVSDVKSSVSGLEKIVGTIDSIDNRVSDINKRGEETMEFLSSMSLNSYNQDNIVSENAFHKDYFKEVLNKSAIFHYYCLYIVDYAINKGMESIDLEAYNNNFVDSVLVSGSKGNENYYNSVFRTIIAILTTYNNVGFIDIEPAGDKMIKVKNINQLLSDAIKEDNFISIKDSGNKKAYYEKFLQFNAVLQGEQDE